MENFGRKLDSIIKELNGYRPRLLLHSCCAPCSSYCLGYLTEYFNVDVFYYNPNITPYEEYVTRLSEQDRLLTEMPCAAGVKLIAGEYDNDAYEAAIRGLENEPEGGSRCVECFRLRLSKAAEVAKANGYEYFTTTLTISPLKNAEVINRIGEETAAKAGVQWLPSDFKKKDGYKRSVELSAEYGLYRQSFCGCKYSKK